MPTLKQRYMDALLNPAFDLGVIPRNDKQSLWQRYWASLTGLTPQSRDRHVFQIRISRSPKRPPGKRPSRFVVAVLGVAFAGVAAIAAVLVTQGYGIGISPSSDSVSPRPTSSSSESQKTFTEESANRLGILVFSSPSGLTARGVPSIPYGTRVQVSCFAPNESGIATINAFYLIKTAPWAGYYAPANMFSNETNDGLPIDSRVPECPRG